MTVPRGSFGSLRPRDFAELPVAQQGTQSLVSVRGRNGRARVLKRAAIDRKLTLHEAQSAVTNLQIYRSELALNGWNLPADSEIKITGSGNAVEIWIIERYIPGGDLSRIDFLD